MLMHEQYLPVQQLFATLRYVAEECLAAQLEYFYNLTVSSTSTPSLLLFHHRRILLHQMPGVLILSKPTDQVQHILILLPKIPSLIHLVFLRLLLLYQPLLLPLRLLNLHLPLQFPRIDLFCIRLLTRLLLYLVDSLFASFLSLPSNISASSLCVKAATEPRSEG